MTVQLTINVPDEIYRVAEHFAVSTGQPVEDVVANLLGYALPLIPAVDPTRPVSTLSDTELMTLTSITMTPEADHRHSELLTRQREGNLAVGERAELQRLQQVYEIAFLYKNQVLVEAAKRGLWTPSNS
jgi:hypothetical protein